MEPPPHRLHWLWKSPNGNIPCLLANTLANLRCRCGRLGPGTGGSKEQGNDGFCAEMGQFTWFTFSDRLGHLHHQLMFTAYLCAGCRVGEFRSRRWFVLCHGVERWCNIVFALPPQLPRLDKLGGSLIWSRLLVDVYEYGVGQLARVMASCCNVEVAVGYFSTTSRRRPMMLFADAKMWGTIACFGSDRSQPQPTHLFPLRIVEPCMGYLSCCVVSYAIVSFAGVYQRCHVWVAWVFVVVAVSGHWLGGCLRKFDPAPHKRMAWDMMYDALKNYSPHMQQKKCIFSIPAWGAVFKAGSIFVCVSG